MSTIASTAVSVGGHVDGHGRRLTDQVALVTGAGSSGGFLGTGAATSLLLAAQGATVGVLDTSRARAEHTSSLIEAEGGRPVTLVADLTDEAAVRAAVDALAEEAGRLDVVVNNAAISGGAPVETARTADWDRVFAVNTRGTMLVCRAAAPHLRRSGGGSIVNVASVAALRGFGSGAYGASKGAVLSLTTDLAYSLGRDGIRVNCVVPGHLHTPMGDQGGERGRELRRRANLLGTEGDAWDVAWTVLFLAGPESRWITAATLPVDAGTTAATGLGMSARMTEGNGAG